MLQLPWHCGATGLQRAMQLSLVGLRVLSQFPFASQYWTIFHPIAVLNDTDAMSECPVVTVYCIDHTPLAPVRTERGRAHQSKMRLLTITSMDTTDVQAGIASARTGDSFGTLIFDGATAQEARPLLRTRKDFG